MGQNQVILRHKKFTVPWAREWVRAKQAGWSKRTREQCERTSKRMREQTSDERVAQYFSWFFWTIERRKISYRILPKEHPGRFWNLNLPLLPAILHLFLLNLFFQFFVISSRNEKGAWIKRKPLIRLSKYIKLPIPPTCSHLPKFEMMICIHKGSLCGSDIFSSYHLDRRTHLEAGKRKMNAIEQKTMIILLYILFYIVTFNEIPRHV